MFLYSVGPSHIDQVIQCDLLHVTAYVTARVPILLLYTPTLKKKSQSYIILTRLRAKKGPAPPPPPPLGNFADISYLEENFKPHLLRDVCTLCSGALVSDSLLHMLL